MYQIISESLTRQERALALLHDLLEEEYQTLLKRDANAIASLEFSIQELIRQLAVEKSLVIKSLAGKRVSYKIITRDRETQNPNSPDPGMPCLLEYGQGSFEGRKVIS